MSQNEHAPLGTTKRDRDYAVRRRHDCWMGLLAAARATYRAEAVEDRERAFKAIRTYAERLVEMGVEPTPEGP